MVITKKSLQRRTFLRGMGVTLALPLLDAMVPALSALAQTPARPVRRFGVLYVPNGVQLQYFVPKTTGKDFELTPILAPLAPFRDQLTVVTNMANAKADPLDQGSGPHSRAQATWLNGCRPKRTSGADVQAGTTLDQFAARELGKDTPLTSLQVGLDDSSRTGNCEGGFSCVYKNGISWQSPTMPLPAEANPYIVFERLFGNAGSPEARRAQMQEGRSILDWVRDDVARLHRRLGGRDRTMVNEYLEAVRAVEERLQKTEQQKNLMPTMEKPYGIPGSFEEHYDLMVDLLVLAYQSDITRVFSFQIAGESSGRSYPQLGFADAHHELSHHQYNPERMMKNAKVNTYHTMIFARFLEKMRSTPDGDGSLLDHAIFLYGSGMGDGNEHYPRHLPTLLVGGGSGQLRGGRHIAAPPETPLMNLGVSVLEKLGVELQSVGDSTGRIADL